MSEDKMIQHLSDISEQLYNINNNLEKIANFFEKWTDFDTDRPSLYVNADVATHEG